MLEINRIYNMDCLIGMKKIDDKSIDMILCDLPYGVTALKWDKIINFEELWKQYERIIKNDGIIALFSNEPFTSLLIKSNLKLFRYKWIWKKESPTGHLNANYKPLNITEEISVFSKATVGSLSKNPIRYYPQDIKEVNIPKKNSKNSKWRKNKGYNSMNNILNSNKPFVQKFTSYPNNILEFKRDKRKFHPTQKPIELLEYLIRTYTSEHDLILDNCIGSGSTAIACINTNRDFLGFEIDENYYKIAEQRIREKIKSK